MNSDARIYVQMTPSVADIDALMRISDGLPPQKSGRRLPAGELHVTLIHFGKLPDALRAIRSAATLTDEDYLRHLDTYAARTQVLLTNDTYRLVPVGYARFGSHGSTLVARYDAPSDLIDIHKRAYAELLAFFAACGIADPHAFARDDPNFRTAGNFSPHVTLYKGYDGPDPDTPLPPLDVSFMKLVY